ncbi:MAG: transporter [Bacteroidota bacterium]|nr:transporter [Bacteroidota bacterium]
MKKSLLILIAFTFFISNKISAQYTEIINSNRPGDSQSAFSVGSNVIQIETGAYLLNEKHELLDNKVKGMGLNFMLRYGLILEELEIQVSGIYQNDQFTDMRSTIDTKYNRSNFKKFKIGAKYLVYDPYKNRDDGPNLYSYWANNKFKWNSLIPAVSVYAGINIDGENNPYTAPGIKGVSPIFTIAAQNNFSNNFVLITNLILERIGTDQNDFEYITTLTYAINSQWVSFIEAHGINSDFYAENMLKFGAAYLSNENLQLDASLVINFKNTPRIFYINFGGSYRFDLHKDSE